MGIFSKIASLFHDDDDEREEIIQAINNLDGVILDDGEGGGFRVEVLPEMSYEEFVALCESLKRQQEGKG